MRLRWEWFRSVAAVPYVATLGVVHPRALTAQLLHDVLDVSGTGKFLPHDKDQRWATSKDLDREPRPLSCDASPCRWAYGVALAEPLQHPR